jgi:hypothetical protein
MLFLKKYDKIIIIRAITTKLKGLSGNQREKAIRQKYVTLGVNVTLA